MKYRTTIISAICICIQFSAIAQLKVEQYQLDNGLTVILNPDYSANNVFGAVAVNTGSKNDPEDATGMSHYLEHLLFKGTDQLGTINYEAEKVHLDSIRALYDELGTKKDAEARNAIQLKINEQSLLAAKYAMPNEFDNLLKDIGSTQVNATTSNDLTIYFNAFPSHQINKWLALYAHRFQNPVFRSFQSELEVVYEEKNRAMDNMQRRLFEEFNKEFYKGHPYGDKGTLGKIEHLKNPSLNKMYAYFDKYYIANNMALILCGNFDPDKVKPFIEDQFNALKRGIIPPKNIPEPRPFNGKEVHNSRLTPIKVGMMGFRTVPHFHPDELSLDVATYLLQNESGTGFLDEMMNDGKIMQAWSFAENEDEAGNQFFIYIPKIFSQSLKGAEKLMFEQIQKLKDGDFTDEQLLAIKNEMYKNHQLNQENISGRGYTFARMYQHGKSWTEIGNYPEQLLKISKQDVMRVANTYFNENFMVLNSRTGFPKKKKLKKPPFEGLKVDQSQTSEFAEAFKKMESEKIKNKFIDFKNDINYYALAGGHQLFVAKNPLNDIYELNINFHYGSFMNPDIEILSSLMNYAHPEGIALLDFKKKIALLGSNYYFSSNPNFFTLNVTGIEAKMGEVLKEINALLMNPIVEEKSMDVVINQFKTNRKAEKEEPFLISRAMAQKAIYGEQSGSYNRSGIKEIKKMEKTKVMDIWEDVKKYASSIHYSGKIVGLELKDKITSILTLSPEAIKNFPHPIDIIKHQEDQIVLLNNSKLLQSNIFMVRTSKPFTMDQYPKIQLFNTYFSGGFSGILTQEIREYRSLAYSSSARFRYHIHPEKESYFFTYIACQADKTNEAVSVAHDLIQNLPEKPERMDNVKNNLILSQSSNFPSFRNLSREIETYLAKGIETDPNIDAIEAYRKLNFQDLKSFYETKIKTQKSIINIYGDLKRLDRNKLEEIAPVKELKLNDFIQF